MSKIFLELERVCKSYDTLNEGYSSAFIDTIKTKIEDMLLNSKYSKSEAIPQIIDFIKTGSIRSIGIKRKLLTFLASLLITANVSASEIKSYFDEQNVSNLVEWQNIGNKADLRINFKVGEYGLSVDDYNKINDFLHTKTNSLTKNIKAVFVVSISNEDNAKINYADDDTKTQKKRFGGTLLQKRMNSVYKIINQLTNTFENEGIKTDFNILSDDKGHFLEITDVTVDGVKTVNTKPDSSIDNDTVADLDYTKYLGGDGELDLSPLSRNYQFVEILKLGGINAERFDNDKPVDEYSRWILNTRKSIKSFITRLQKSYPEYEISFDKSAKATTPIKMAARGMSNSHNQMPFQESYLITSFDNFICENYTDSLDILKKWKYILGITFPKLTPEQAANFDSNIEKLLRYLEQIYGKSVINFTFNK